MNPTGDAAPFEPSALARLPLLLLRRADEFGLNRDQLMRKAGIDDLELSDPDTRIPIRKVWALWGLAVAETGDETLPLRIASTTPLRSYGLVGYLMALSRTLSDSFERLERFGRIVTEAVGYHWERDNAAGRMTLLEHTLRDPARSITDARLAFLVAAARELTQQRVLPREVHLPYARPADVSILEQTFSSTMLFDRPQAGIILDARDLDLAVGGADPTLVGYLDDLAERHLRAMPATDEFQDRVRRAIWVALREGQASVTRVASALAVSPRTLQRRLRQEGTSYVDLLDAVRRELAMGLLRGRDLAVYEIAFLLGYSEPSTFHRAFRRWTGTSPRVFRKESAS